MKRWFWILDSIAVLSFAFIGSDFHGFRFDLIAILGVATPFLIALAGGIAVTKAWTKPLSILNSILLALITLVVGMLLRNFLWGDGTPQAFVLVTGGWFLATMVGWRLIALAAVWFVDRSKSHRATT